MRPESCGLLVSLNLFCTLSAHHLYATQTNRLSYGKSQFFIDAIWTFYQFVPFRFLAVILPETIFGLMKNCNAMNQHPLVLCHCIRNTIFCITTFPPLARIA